MKIDFFTFLSNNSANYAEFLKYTCEKFLSGRHEIDWKCIESVGCDRIPDGYKLVAKAEDMGYASMNHGSALNLATNYVESEYVIFIDADMAILYKDWDQVILNELSTYDCFGGAFGNGLRRYRNFPSVFLFAFRSNIMNKVELDFLPRLLKNGKHVDKHVLDAQEAIYYSMKPGKTIHCDTGWRLPFIVKKAGLTYNAMEAVYITSNDVQLHFEDEQQRELCMQKPKHMSEWHYKGKLFASHKHTSGAHALDSELGNAWKRRIESYIKKLQGVMV